MRQRTQVGFETECFANRVNDSFGAIETGDVPTLTIHPIKKRSAAAPEIEQPTLSVWRQRAPLRAWPATQPREWGGFSRAIDFRFVRRIVAGIELADR